MAPVRQTSAADFPKQSDRLLKCLPFTCNSLVDPLQCSSLKYKTNAAMSQKTCFLTIGATASFSALVEAALKPDFVSALEAQGYTDLLVQYGEGGKEIYDKALQQSKGASKLKVSGFDLDKSGLGRYMRQAKAVGASNKDSSEGVVISHAGKVSFYHCERCD